MGDIADQHREMIEEYTAAAWGVINRLDDQELVDSINMVVVDKQYEESSFTPLVKNITKYYQENQRLSAKQRKVLRAHLADNFEVYDPYFQW